MSSWKSLSVLQEKRYEKNFWDGIIFLFVYRLGRKYMNKKVGVQKRIEEVIELASINNYQIGYNIAVDILRNPENDEDYLAEEPGVDLFILRLVRCL